MKKFLGLIFVLILVTTLLAGCKKEVVAPQSIQQNFLPAQMSTEKTNYKSSVTDIKYTIINKGNTVVTFGEEYSLQKNENKKWVDIPFKKNISFVAIEHILNPNKKYEGDITLTASDYTFNTGRYRIIIRCYIKDKDNFNVGCDFYIN